jgi:hypothetical protein
MAMIEQIRKYGWLAVEAAFLLIVLCILLNVILGEAGGEFIGAVAGNAMDFLQKVPPGLVVGLVLVVVLYRYIRPKLQK